MVRWYRRNFKAEAIIPVIAHYMAKLDPCSLVQVVHADAIHIMPIRYVSQLK